MQRLSHSLLVTNAASHSLTDRLMAAVVVVVVAVLVAIYTDPAVMYQVPRATAPSGRFLMVMVRHWPESCPVVVCGGGGGGGGGGSVVL